MGLIAFIKNKINSLADDDEDEFDDEYYDDSEYEDIDDEEVEEEVANEFPEDIKKYTVTDVQNYIKNQCDIMDDAAKEITKIQKEYDEVKNYFSDIQIIETAPDEIRDEINRTALTVAELVVDRRIYKSGENRMSQRDFFKMERLDPYMPDALFEFQNNEAYYETVKKDMRMLEGEQLGLRQEASDLIKRQKNILLASKASAIMLFLVFGVFAIATVVMGELGQLLFTIVIALAGVLVVGLVWMLMSTKREAKIVELKLNRAAMLLNKVKIKYINIAATVEYEREKYAVKDSRELGNLYQTYLMVRKEQKKVAAMTEQLSDAEVKLEGLLKQLVLFDPHVWLGQVKALIDPKEMVEVRHGLSSRRQKLRSKIQYNENRIDEAKTNITQVAIARPDCKAEVLAVISQYEE